MKRRKVRECAQCVLQLQPGKMLHGSKPKHSLLGSNEMFSAKLVSIMLLGWPCIVTLQHPFGTFPELAPCREARPLAPPLPAGIGEALSMCCVTLGHLWCLCSACALGAPGSAPLPCAQLRQGAELKLAQAALQCWSAQQAREQGVSQPA